MRNLPHSVTKTLVALLTLLALASLVAAAILVTPQNSNPNHDGETPFPTIDSARTGENILSAADGTAREEHVTTPGVTTSVTPGALVGVKPVAPVTVRVGDATEIVWTSESTLGSFLQEIDVPLDQGQQIYADGILVPESALEHTPLPRMVEIGRFVTVTIHDGPRMQVIHASAGTVSEVLEGAGITLDPADGVSPELEAQVSEDMHISIRRSFPLTVRDGENTVIVRSYHTDIGSVLADAGIELYGDDFTVPGESTVLNANDLIDIIRVTEDFYTVDEEMPYQTIWQATDELAIDTQAILVGGKPGILRRRIRVRYENGMKVSDEVDAEWVALEPINAVVGYGTRIELRLVDTPDGPREYWRVVRMRATSYTAASSGKDPEDPEYGRTASGVPAGFGVVAIDRNIVPFRSYVYVPGYGVGFAGDTGGGIRGRWIDLGYDEDNFVSWSGYVDVYFLAPAPPPEDINYLLPNSPP